MTHPHAQTPLTGPRGIAFHLGGPPANDHTTLGLTMTRDGDSWRIAWNGVALHAADGKGLRYLAMLVERPHQPVHVGTLAGIDPCHIGGADAVLDARAMESYRERLAALREQHEEALAFDDVARASQLGAARATLEHHLASALGLGGRARPLGSAAERVRINVQRRIKNATHRIGAHHAPLGQYLAMTIKTGMTCVYAPL